MPKTAKTPAGVLISLMDEYQLNPFSLSKALNLSPSTVRLLVAGKSKITVPAALRLAKLFGQKPSFWLDLQKEADLEEAAQDYKLMGEVKNIVKAKKPAAKKPAAKKAGQKAKAKKPAAKKPAAKKPAAKKAMAKKTAVKAKVQVKRAKKTTLKDKRTETAKTKAVKPAAKKAKK